MNPADCASLIAEFALERLSQGEGGHGVFVIALDLGDEPARQRVGGRRRCSSAQTRTMSNFSSQPMVL